MKQKETLFIFALYLFLFVSSVVLAYSSPTSPRKIRVQIWHYTETTNKIEYLQCYTEGTALNKQIQIMQYTPPPHVPHPVALELNVDRELSKLFILLF